VQAGLFLLLATLFAGDSIPLIYIGGGALASIFGASGIPLARRNSPRIRRDFVNTAVSEFDAHGCARTADVEVFGLVV
jgi:hypothetical protein